MTRRRSISADTERTAPARSDKTDTKSAAARCRYYLPPNDYDDDDNGRRNATQSARRSPVLCTRSPRRVFCLTSLCLSICIPRKKYFVRIRLLTFEFAVHCLTLFTGHRYAIITITPSVIYPPYRQSESIFASNTSVTAAAASD
ncbi:Hypothetical protein CINCED_3A023896 [Cinara cedri]|uniref:Uncharacterized protein n=1 Tax=Cinara cedri TaxID=506608 RepID=A0A5E4NJB9_9HEMI|nr:Hypothetical protein CINCED_3A023896 [Cinara cedri]